MATFSRQCAAQRRRTCALPYGRVASVSTALVQSSWRGRSFRVLLRDEASGRMRRLTRKGLHVQALDAAQPFDYEGRAAAKINQSNRLKIGIVGFGTFGQFLARRIVRHGHQVIAVSRTDYSKRALEMGVRFFTCLDDFSEQHPDIVILASSILSTRSVLEALPVQRLRRSTLFVDVLSVKVFPKRLLSDKLPASMDILCTHPMFGPDSGKNEWTGLNFQYEKIFRSEGCRMVEMTCEEHDRQAANTQFITHTVGRVLGEMKLEGTSINTKGYESLLALVQNTSNDSFELYYGLFMYNQNSTETLERLEHAFDDIKKKLFDQLHEAVRQQIFPMAPEATPGPKQLPEGRVFSSQDQPNGSQAADAAVSR